MLLELVRWNMLNVVSVELGFNCYKLWALFAGGSLQSAKGQFALASLAVNLLALLATQFCLGWLLSLYSLYLLVGVCHWAYRRVHFEHRFYDIASLERAVVEAVSRPGSSCGPDQAAAASATQAKQAPKSLGGRPQGSASTPAASRQGDSSAPVGQGDSLALWQVRMYREFQRLTCSERHYSRADLALSLAHLSHVCRLVASENAYDSMTFQMLATRRDVLNVLLRLALFAAASLLASFR